ncbi:hypothetical protein EVAR_17535_1 [Eumeta japonica]|uniref:Uncharacterized protein n=1 Tax=Eumeta variegata TaxID=151549 RepID=A0A4C1WRI3_EUMVA|nr:hypothetical protein EVAR_17535_1 [Eumeta japonica]
MIKAGWERRRYDVRYKYSWYSFEEKPRSSNTTCPRISVESSAIRRQSRTRVVRPLRQPVISERIERPPAVRVLFAFTRPAFIRVTPARLTVPRFLHAICPAAKNGSEWARDGRSVDSARDEDIYESEYVL